MSRVFVLALATFREAVRDKILHSILFFAGLLLVLSLGVRELSVGDTGKAVQGVALGGIALIGAVIAVFLGVSLVWKELERKTIYTLASKPLPRWQILLGKYAGLWLTLVVEVAAMTALYIAILGPTEGWPSGPTWVALGMLVMELTLLCAWATLFSTLAAPTSAAGYTLSVYVIGHFADDLLRFGQASDDPGFRSVALALYRVVPNLEAFNLRAEAIHGVVVPASELLATSAYGLGMTAAVLGVAMLVFQSRDFK